MTVEASVAPRLPVALNYQTSTRIDAPAGGVAGGTRFDFLTKTFTAKKDHHYLAVWSSSALVNLASGQSIVYDLRVNSDIVASAKYGADRGNSAVVMALPISLNGVWVAPADGSASLVVSATPAGLWADWVVPVVFSQLAVVDLGARGAE